MSVFFCDSNCELWWDKVEELNIKFISMPYVLDNEVIYYDLGKNSDSKAFFEKMRKGAAPKTTALNMNDYIEYIEPVFASGEDIIYITFSHQMSGTFNSLNMALEELKTKYPDRKATVVDTKHISIGAGYVVEEAAKLHNAGKSDEEVKEFVESFREKIGCYFTISDLVYLKRGGRLTAFKAMLGTIFDLKPIVSTIDGKLDNIVKSKGRKRSLKDLCTYLEKDYVTGTEVDLSYPITILEADSMADAELVKENIKAKYPDAEVRIQPVGPVIGSHCGPDTIGVIFVKK